MSLPYQTKYLNLLELLQTSGHETALSKLRESFPEWEKRPEIIQATEIYYQDENPQSDIIEFKIYSEKYIIQSFQKESDFSLDIQIIATKPSTHILLPGFKSFITENKHLYEIHYTPINPPNIDISQPIYIEKITKINDCYSKTIRKLKESIPKAKRWLDNTGEFSLHQIALFETIQQLALPIEYGQSEYIIDTLTGETEKANETP